MNESIIEFVEQYTNPNTNVRYWGIFFGKSNVGNYIKKSKNVPALLETYNDDSLSYTAEQLMCIAEFMIELDKG